MTRSDYDRLKELSAETKRLKKRLRAGKSASFVPAVNYFGTGGNASTGDSVSRMVCDWSDLEERITSNTVEMGNIIDTMPDKCARDILDKKYLKYWTWVKIAMTSESMKFKDESGPRHYVERLLSK